MSIYLTLIILGLGTGAIYSSFALGIVLTYQGSGVLNFSQGAVATYVAYVYASMTSTGKYPIPPLPNPLAIVQGISDHWIGHPLKLPSWPTFISTGGPSSEPVGIAVALGTAVLLGLLIQALILRPLRHAPALSKVVATVGILLVLQAVVELRFGSLGIPVGQILSTAPVRVVGTTVPANRLLLLAIVVAAAIVLRLAFRFTRFGLATRAAAGNEKGAILLGYSPDGLATANWVISSVLAGLLGILVAPITQLDPANYTAFVIPALGAALVAGFSSFELAVAVGLFTGCLQSVLLYVQSRHTWLPASTPDAIPFIIIVLAMVFQGRALPVRGALTGGRQQRVPRPRYIARSSTIVVLVAVVMAIFVDGAWREALITSSAGFVVALSLVVVVGYIGQISLAQMALAGTAAFSLGAFATELNIPFPFAPLLACVVATGIGIVVGLPALRVRGVNLAVITLGLAFAVDSLVFTNPTFTRHNRGLSVPDVSIFGMHFGPSSVLPFGSKQVPGAPFAIFGVVLALGLGLVVVNLRRSPTGGRFLAVRGDERAAAGAGINVASTKLCAFGLSAFIAGVGGCLTVYGLQSVTEVPFATLTSIAVLAVAYLGGITGVGGAVIAGILTAGGITTVLTNSVFHAGQWIPLLTAIGLLVTVVTNPEGIAGGLGLAWVGIRGRRRALSRDGRGEFSPEVAKATTNGASEMHPDAEVGAGSRDIVAAHASRVSPGPEISGPGSADRVPPLIDLQSLTAGYNGHPVVWDLSLQVKPGEVVALLGPNGAGKSTTLLAISGLLPPLDGAIRVLGDAVTGRRPHRVALRGLSHVAEDRSLFFDLSVQDNIRLAKVSRRRRSAACDEAFDLFPALVALRHRRAGLLSGGEQQMLAMARALASRPRVLLVDEMSLGLAPVIAEQLLPMVRTFADELGAGILLVEQHVHLALAVADRAYVLNHGRLMAEGAASELSANSHLLEVSYLGEALA